MPPETTEVETPVEETAQQPAPATRDDLIAAVKAASGEPAATAAVETPTAVDAQETKLDRIFRERQKAHGERQAADNYAAEQRRLADEARDKILADARAAAEQLVKDEAAKLAERYRTDPLGTMRSIGKDPQSLVDDVLRANTPEAKALERAEAAERAAKSATERADGAVKTFEDWKSEQARLETEQRVSHAQAVFVRELASPTAAPALNARYEPGEIWEKSVAVMKDLVASGQRYGVDFDDRDVVAYLERQSRDRLAKVSPASHQVSEAAPVTEPGTAPKVQATGPRTLSAAHGSERRTSPKPLYQLPPDQRRQALIDDVAAARRNNPKAEF